MYRPAIINDRTRNHRKMAKSAQRAKKVTLANKSLNYAVVQS